MLELPHNYVTWSGWPQNHSGVSTLVTTSTQVQLYWC